MTVAIKLAEQGYPVTVFEWKGRIGGLLQYGIPEFRLPKSFLDRYQTRMEEMGITIRTNTTIGSVLVIDELFRDGYAGIFIGTGAEKPRTLGLEGESLGNVMFGLNYLMNPKGHDPVYGRKWRPEGDRVSPVSRPERKEERVPRGTRSLRLTLRSLTPRA